MLDRPTKPKIKVQILNKLLCFLLILMVILGTIMVTYSSFVISPEAQKQKDDAILTLNGELSPFEIDIEKPFYVFIGARVPFHFTGEQLAEGISLNNFITSPFGNVTSDEFHIDLLNGKFQVSASIRDSDGKLITQIVNNTWKTVDPNYQLAYWDRNYNDYAFEVITSNYVPILQVAMVGSNEIQFDGLFYTEDGFVRLAPMSNGGASFTYYPKSETFEEVNKNESIPLLFKYPALTNASNLGKMENPFYPTTDPLAEASSKMLIVFVLQVTGSLFIAVFGVAFPIAIAVKNKSKNLQKEKRRTQSTVLTKHPSTNLYWKQHSKRQKQKKKKKKE
jgi:hypothetical protein